MKNYYIETDNTFSLNKKTEDLISNNNFNDASKSIYLLDETPLENALEDLDTYSFLTTKKVIIIKNIDSIKADEQVEEKEHLIKYLQNPNEDNLLIITANKLDKKLKLYKEITKYTEVITPEYNSIDIVKEILKDYNIKNTDIDYIIELCDNDQIKIKNECEKLKIYCIKEKTITKEQIDEIVVKKFGDPQNLVFSFTRYIAENDKTNALNIYRELLNYGKHPLEIVSLIANQLRSLLKIKLLEEQNYNKNQISEIINKKPFYVEKQQQLTRLYNLCDIRDLIKKLQDIDMKMKTTDLDYNMLIEMYIVNI